MEQVKKILTDLKQFIVDHKATPPDYLKAEECVQLFIETYENQQINGASIADFAFNSKEIKLAQSILSAARKKLTADRNEQGSKQPGQICAGEWEIYEKKFDDIEKISSKIGKYSKQEGKM